MKLRRRRPCCKRPHSASYWGLGCRAQKVTFPENPVACPAAEEGGSRCGPAEGPGGCGAARDAQRRRARPRCGREPAGDADNLPPGAARRLHPCRVGGGTGGAAEECKARTRHCNNGDRRSEGCVECKVGVMAATFGLARPGVKQRMPLLQVFGAAEDARGQRPPLRLARRRRWGCC